MLGILDVPVEVLRMVIQHNPAGFWRFRGICRCLNELMLEDLSCSLYLRFGVCEFSVILKTNYETVVKCPGERLYMDIENKNAEALFWLSKVWNMQIWRLLVPDKYKEWKRLIFLLLGAPTNGDDLDLAAACPNLRRIHFQKVKWPFILETFEAISMKTPLLKRIKFGGLDIYPMRRMVFNVSQLEELEFANACFSTFWSTHQHPEPGCLPYTIPVKTITIDCHFAFNFNNMLALFDFPGLETMQCYYNQGPCRYNVPRAKENLLGLYKEVEKYMAHPEATRNNIDNVTNVNVYCVNTQSIDTTGILVICNLQSLERLQVEVSEEGSEHDIQSFCLNLQSLLPQCPNLTTFDCSVNSQTYDLINPLNWTRTYNMAPSRYYGLDFFRLVDRESIKDWNI